MFSITYLCRDAYDHNLIECHLPSPLKSFSRTRRCVQSVKLKFLKLNSLSIVLRNHCGKIEQTNTFSSDAVSVLTSARGPKIAKMTIRSMIIDQLLDQANSWLFTILYNILRKYDWLSLDCASNSTINWIITQRLTESERITRWMLTLLTPLTDYIALSSNLYKGTDWQMF